MINNKLKQQLEQPRQPTDSPLARSLTKAVYRKLLFGSSCNDVRRINKEMQVVMENQNGRRLRCRHCDHVWTYLGHSPYYACCSRCRYPVNVVKCREDNTRVLGEIVNR
jgi:hypothetical protein